MQVALLGPLLVRDGSGAPVDVGGRRVRTLLTLLALNAGQVVTRSYLIDRIWAGTRPTARRTRCRRRCRGCAGTCPMA